MVKIKIEHIQPPANCDYIEFNQYAIHFGTENTFKFRTQTAAQLFLNKLNNFINDTIYKLNHIYTEVFSEYRQVWTYIETKDVYVQKINDIENKFNKLTRKVNPVNYPYFLHHDLLYLIDLLLNFAENIEALNRDKKLYASYNRLKMFINMLNELSEKIKTIDLK